MGNEDAHLEELAFYTNTFLETAKSDLDASKILFNSKLCPQACYILQQASEKGFKSFCLAFRLVERNEVRNLGHYPVERLLKSIIEKKGQLKIYLSSSLPLYLKIILTFFLHLWVKANYNFKIALI